MVSIKLLTDGNNKKDKDKEESIFSDQKVEPKWEEDIKEEKSCQFHDSEYVEFWVQ